MFVILSIVVFKFRDLYQGLLSGSGGQSYKINKCLFLRISLPLQMIPFPSKPSLHWHL